MVGHADGGRAVGLLARSRGQTLGHLQLDHHEDALDLRCLLEDPQHDGRGHVVGQIRHQRPRTVLRRDHGIPVCGLCVAEKDLGVSQHVPVREDLDEPRIDLHGAHLSPRLEQRLGERSEASADLEDAVTLAHPSQPNDASQRVRIDHEVLPKLATRTKAAGREQISCFAPRQAHQETVTLTAPAESGAMAENTEVSRSMIRPGFAASRSVTTHEAVAPVATLRTITLVPIGSHGLAH